MNWSNFNAVTSQGLGQRQATAHEAVGTSTFINFPFHLGVAPGSPKQNEWKSLKYCENYQNVIETQSCPMQLDKR